MNHRLQHVQFKPEKEQLKFPKLWSCSLWPRLWLELSSSLVLKWRFSSLFHSDESYSIHPPQHPHPYPHKSAQPPNTTIIITSTPQTQSLSCYRLKSTLAWGHAGWHCIETSLWVFVFFSHRLLSSPKNIHSSNVCPHFKLRIQMWDLSFRGGLICNQFVPKASFLSCSMMCDGLLIKKWFCLVVLLDTCILCWCVGHR